MAEKRQYHPARSQEFEQTSYPDLPFVAGDSDSASPADLSKRPRDGIAHVIRRQPDGFTPLSNAGECREGRPIACSFARLGSPFRWIRASMSVSFGCSSWPQGDVKVTLPAQARKQSRKATTIQALRLVFRLAVLSAVINSFDTPRQAPASSMFVVLFNSRW